VRSRQLTRRQRRKGAAGGAGLVALGGAALSASSSSGHLRRLPAYASKSEGPVRRLVSRPNLHPPVMSVDTASLPLASATGGAVAPGYLFLGPSAGNGVQAGPLLVDHQGEPVWFKPIPRALWATDIRLAHYRHQPVVTWWEGKMNVIGFGQGEGVIVDSSYREVARVRAGNGRSIDIHEFILTPEGTALFTCFPKRVPADLSEVGGPSDGSVLEGVIQEVDIASGRVVFEWRSLDHIPVSESYFPPQTAYGYDYLHLNSIDIMPDGHLLVSARHSWALYKIHRRTGHVLWRLGGKNSDFALGRGAQFYWQHDARHHPDGTISVFDDGAALFADGSGYQKTESQSRGVVLDIDNGGKAVQLARSYRHPHRVLANAMGNFQTLPDGRILIGWGSNPTASEFLPDGTLIADTRLGKKHDSYRTYKYPWTATPADPPQVAARRDRRSGRATLYVTWNGATEVARWLVSTGSHPSAVRPVGVARRHGFETAIRLPAHHSGYAKVTALNSAGHHLRSSDAVRL
jgi:Arylsulfotransferase (ASST)